MLTSTTASTATSTATCPASGPASPQRPRHRVATALTSLALVLSPTAAVAAVPAHASPSGGAVAAEAAQRLGSPAPRRPRPALTSVLVAAVPEGVGSPGARSAHGLALVA